MLSAALLLGLAVIAAAAWVSLRARHPDYVLDRYDVATVVRKPISSTAQFPGVVGFAVSRTITASAAAEVLAVTVHPGDDVRRGQVLLTMKSPALQDAVVADSGSLARAQRARARVVLDRASEAAALERGVALAAARDARSAAALASARELFDAGYASRSELEVAALARVEAGAALAEAQDRAAAGGPAYELAIAGLDQDIADALARRAHDQELLDALTVRSPFDGTIVEVNVHAGQEVEPRGALLTVVDRGAPVVRFEVPERQAGLVAAGQAVTIVTAEGRSAGTVSSVAAEATGASATTSAAVAVTAVFAAPPRGLRSGISADVEMVLGASPDALVLSRGTWLSGGNESWVYVVRDGKAVKTAVALGVQNAREVELSRGVTEGDRVIVSSYEEFMARESISLAPGGGVKP
jgi:HlyD family secretion protein